MQPRHATLSPPQEETSRGRRRQNNAQYASIRRSKGREAAVDGLTCVGDRHNELRREETQKVEEEKVGKGIECEEGEGRREQRKLGGKFQVVLPQSEPSSVCEVFENGS